MSHTILFSNKVGLVNERKKTSDADTGAHAHLELYLCSSLRGAAEPTQQVEPLTRNDYTYT